MREKLSERLEALCAIKGRPFTVAERAESLILMSRAADALRAVEGAAVGLVNTYGEDDELAVFGDAIDGMKIGQRVALVPLDVGGSAEGVEGV